MDAKFKATKPDDIQMTMTITMSLGAWKALRDDLKKQCWTAQELSIQIRDMVMQAEKTFMYLPKPEEG